MVKKGSCGCATGGTNASYDQVVQGGGRHAKKSAKTKVKHRSRSRTVRR